VPLEFTVAVGAGRAQFRRAIVPPHTTELINWCPARSTYDSFHRQPDRGRWCGRFTFVGLSSASSLRSNLAQGRFVPSPRNRSMATASKSSGKKARRKTTAASKRPSTRGKSASKSARGPKRKASTKVTSRSGSPRKSSAKRTGTRSARKQSPVTRIKRVASTVLQQGATAAKQGVQAVAGLVENVKDRVAT